MSYLQYLLEGLISKNNVPPNPIKDKLGQELAKKYKLVYKGYQPLDDAGGGDFLYFNVPEKDNTTIAAKDEKELQLKLKRD